MLLCQPSNYVRSEALLAVNRERVNLRHADNRDYKLIGRMLVCFDVSPELPNNSPKLTICFLISEPPIEEVYLEVLFSSVADTAIKVRTQRKASDRQVNVSLQPIINCWSNNLNLFDLAISNHFLSF